jgi:hypothetical protein
MANSFHNGVSATWPIAHVYHPQKRAALDVEWRVVCLRTFTTSVLARGEATHIRADLDDNRLDVASRLSKRGDQIDPHNCVHTEPER